MKRKIFMFVQVIIFVTGISGTQLPAAEVLFYLHSQVSGGVLDTNPPTAAAESTRSSGTVTRSNFVEVGTWSTAPQPAAFDLIALGDLHAWVGRRFTDPNGNSDNSENTGTFFDI